MNHSSIELQIRDYRLEGYECGDGPPVLFVHGSVSDHRTWLPRLAAFAGHYRAIAYSRRYHWPNQPIIDGTDYGMDQQVEDLAAVIDTLGIAPVRLIGHSYGAYLGILLAVRRPDLLHALVLAEPPVVTLFVSDPPTPIEILRLLATRPRAAAAVIEFGARGLGPAREALRAGERERGLAIFGKAALGPKAFEELSPARLVQVRDNLIDAEFLGSGFAPVRADEVRGIDKPALLVTGSRSPALFHHLSARLLELLPRSHSALIADASHIVHEDNPAEFDGAVLQFLKEQEHDLC